MENKKLGQEPAFACECITANGNDGHIQEGISKRFYAACLIMQGIMANQSPEMIRLDVSDVAKVAYAHADELLKQESL